MTETTEARNARFMPPEVAAKHWNVSRKTLLKLANECNAVHKFSTRLLMIDNEAIEQYLLQH